jgi:lipoprotein NlpD
VENPNKIEVGQVLRVAPPPYQVAASGVVTKPVSRWQCGRRHSGLGSGGSKRCRKTCASGQFSACTGSGCSSFSSSPPPFPTVQVPPMAMTMLAWIWPTSGGPVLAGFDEVKNKGLDIGGTALGEPVRGGGRRVEWFT